jgi:hypothetical protein
MRSKCRISDQQDRDAAYVSEESPEFVKTVVAKILKGKGDELR